MTKWKLKVEYKGAGYAGWQWQEHMPSIQQAIEEAIRAFCQQEIRIYVAGRTDAGVHAAGQVCHFDLDYGDRDLTGHALAQAINAHLRPQPIAILSAEEAPEDFHARYSAKGKHYIYTVLNRQAPPALDEGLVWHIRRTLDVVAMRTAAAHLIGHHDFTTFRAAECQAKSPLKTLDSLEIEERVGGKILFHARGRSFLHHQVRNMVGTLVLVGEGKWTPDEVRIALEAKDRARGGPTAPPQGLSLIEVFY